MDYFSPEKQLAEEQFSPECAAPAVRPCAFQRGTRRIRQTSGDWNTLINSKLAKQAIVGGWKATLLKVHTKLRKKNKWTRILRRGETTGRSRKPCHLSANNKRMRLRLARDHHNYMTGQRWKNWVGQHILQQFALQFTQGRIARRGKERKKHRKKERKTNSGNNPAWTLQDSTSSMTR